MSSSNLYCGKLVVVTAEILQMKLRVCV